MLDFPNAPTVGQVYPSPAVAGVPQWRWDGSEWVPNVVPFTAAPPVVRGHLHGLTISMTGSSSSFTVAAGIATDSTFVDTMVLAPAIAKTTGAWAAGTGNGALDTGAIANNTWYHVYLIKNPTSGAVDVLISLAAVTPTLLPTGYTLFRRIGSMKTNASGQWYGFLQIGDNFYWTAPVLDFSGVTLTANTPTNRALASVPLGLSVQPLYQLVLTQAATATSRVRVYSPLLPDNNVVPNYTLGGSLSGPTALTLYSEEQNCFTDTSQNLRFWTNDSNLAIAVFTMGWIDTRGRYF